MPWFDNWGWASETEIPDRFTIVPLPPRPYPDGHAANFTGHVWKVIPYSAPPQPTVPEPEARRITKLAFRNRFTPAEKAAIELASVHNQSLAVNDPANLLAAGLRASLADQRDAAFIDLNRTDTRDGTHMLETYGLIGTGRAVQILDAPITDQERYME